MCTAAVLGARFRCGADSCLLADANGNLDGSAGDGGEGDEDHPPANYGRRRSRAVLYQLSGHYKPDKMKTKLKLNNNLLSSTDAPLPEYKTASVKKSRFIISHYGMFKGAWDWLILMATFYVAVVVPYNASFETERPSVILDVLVEALFFIGSAGRQLKLRSTSSSIVLPCAEEEAHIWKLSRRRENSAALSSREGEAANDWM
nr:unnamed protein product [Callosobruchus chinensis]